jgi:peptidoglycan-associated lipoprotein
MNHETATQSSQTKSSSIALAPSYKGNRTVFFEFNSSALNNETKESLDDQIVWMKENPKTKFVIEGYCDELGSEEYNKALGSRRAEAVKEYMVKNDIDEYRIKTVSYGKSRPLDLDHTEEAWAKNRRAVTISPLKN